MTRRLAKNSAWGAAGFLGATLILLFTTPIYVRLLGAERFGLFSLLVAITAPLGILNAGLAQATTKYVAQFGASQMWSNAARMIETTMLFNFAWGLLGALLLWLGAPWIATKLFQLSPDMFREAMWAFRLTGIIWLLSQISGTYQAVITGLQDFRTLTSIQFFQQLATYGLGSVVLLFIPRVWAVLVPQIVVGMFLIGLCFRFINKRIPEVRWSPHWDKESARLSIGFSSWQVVDSVTATAANQADRLVLGSFVDTAAVGYYSVAAAAQARLVGFVWTLFAAVFPAISSLSASSGQSERLILNYGWKVSLFAGVLYSTAFVVGPEFLQIWLGNSVSVKAAPILRVLMGVALAGLPSAILAQYLLGHGLTKWSTLSSFFTSVLSLGLTWVFVKHFGVGGAAWGGLVGLILTRPLFHIWVFKKRFGSLFSASRCFWILYGVLVSTCLGCWVASIVHNSFREMLGLYLGFAASVVVVPLIILAISILLEGTLMGHRDNVKDLQSNLRRGWTLTVAKVT